MASAHRPFKIGPILPFQSHLSLLHALYAVMECSLCFNIQYTLGNISKPLFSFFLPDSSISTRLFLILTTLKRKASILRGRKPWLEVESHRENCNSGLHFYHTPKYSIKRKRQQTVHISRLVCVSLHIQGEHKSTA